MKSNLSFYFAVFLRRIHYFLIVFLTVAAISITLARILPPSYYSEARLVVEPPVIDTSSGRPQPGQLGAAEELQIIEEQLMTRQNLLDIARRENAFENMGDMTADEIVAKMVKKTSITRIAGRGQATLMYVGFSSTDPKKAATIVNDYVSLILKNNAAEKLARANSKLEFFQRETDRLGALLQDQSAKITEFKNSNIDALPDTLNYRLSQQTTLQDQLNTIQRQLANLQEQRRNLVDLFNATGQVGNASGNNLSPEQKTLIKLQDQLRQALAVYSPENPKVKLIQKQIEQQKAIVAGQISAGSGGTNNPNSLLDINLASIDSQIKILEDQHKQVTDQLAKLKDSIDRTPANAIKLGELDREYQNTQRQYNTAVANLSQASINERVQSDSKGQRIAVIEPPTVPNKPAKPNRLLIAVGGTLFGAFLGAALIALLELLNNSIRRPTEITKQLGITPIATVPYIRTPMELVMRRAVLSLVFVVVVIGIPAALYAIHTYYMPLDLIYDKLAHKIRSFV